MFTRWYASPGLRSVTIRPPVPMACVVVNSRKMRIFFMVRPYPAVTRDQFAGPQNTELTTFDMNVFQILDVAATAAQVGYDSGTFFFLPLGDLMERRRLIVSLIYVCVVCLAAQAGVISLLPEARSRLNTLYMVARFGGGAAGSALGALVWSWAKWPGVCVFCLGLSFVALLVHFIGLQRGARVGHRS